MDQFVEARCETVGAASDQSAAVDLEAIASSDIFHCDVTNMNQMAVKSYEHGVVDEDKFRKFVLEQPVELRTGLDPKFFDGTRVSDAINTP